MAKRLDTPFVVAGATARDLILWHVYGIQAGRATRDVDVAVCAVSWESYEALIGELVSNEGFQRDDRAAHRLLLGRGDASGTIPLDLVPFGDIEAPEGSIAWPPEGAWILTVLGFREAVDTAVQVEVEADVVVPVVSLAALTLLKLIAWKDRRQQENKDAADLLLILRNYLWAGNGERMWTDAADLMEAYGFDDSTASCALLGRDARNVALPATREKLLSLLGSDRTYQMLLRDLLARAAAVPFDDGYADKLEADLEAFRDGFMAEP
ncbi:nucleotidyl transferase AbiEii/AbiGii toxin family protein [Paraburkholderia sp. LEh10]|uniref:nucleotidyl transferase AbiEii/AbiGii toxin family protein n=1 Tax=Paraburkholderia sp. LEh10 TaxID=2821353 RepID=UPI001AE95DB6|nr:nucleotidyl transferase AbiEii/AbiGii toxin family protein [Paraburkholderia sp. LEh10]MBP0594495.1 nucleotidyl transferase AbiEii/AbiGii toxin family protein [Paraburkholderia sp. LEh10]